MAVPVISLPTPILGSLGLHSNISTPAKHALAQSISGHSCPELSSFKKLLTLVLLLSFTFILPSLETSLPSLHKASLVPLPSIYSWAILTPFSCWEIPFSSSLCPQTCNPNSCQAQLSKEPSNKQDSPEPKFGSLILIAKHKYFFLIHSMFSPKGVVGGGLWFSCLFHDYTVAQCCWELGSFISPVITLKMQLLGH